MLRTSCTVPSKGTPALERPRCRRYEGCDPDDYEDGRAQVRRARGCHHTQNACIQSERTPFGEGLGHDKRREQPRGEKRNR